MNEKLKEKFKEALAAVMPITIIVFAICFSVVKVSSDNLMLFLVGAVFLIFGMSLFSLGAETSMSLIGERVGATICKSKKVWVIALISFIVGTIITIAEPDLQVLATQIVDIPNIVLITTVGIGVGIFLAIAMLRMVLKIRLSRILAFLYLLVFILSFFIHDNFLPMAFDAGGVTTGPLTVPFIIALGIGAATIRSDKNSESDSFGLVALCSVGPILAVMILGLVYSITQTNYVPFETPPIEVSTDISQAFLSAIPTYCIDVFKSLVPIIIFFVLYQITYLKMPKNELIKVFVGMFYTYLGLVLFLTGAKVGFLPVGNSLGMSIMNIKMKWIIILIMEIVGYFIVQAEPAVNVLVKQVNEITDGMVSEGTMKTTLSIGMSIALIISVLRAWFGIPIYFFLITGYLVTIILSFFVSEMFTGIAFDSGGVASGPMTASFLLPLVIGIAENSRKDKYQYYARFFWIDCNGCNGSNNFSSSCWTYVQKEIT